jgi:hypothetical protein
MRMLRDLPDERTAVGLGHPVLRLDLLFGIHPRLEAQFQGGALLRLVAQAVLAQRIKALRVHAPASVRIRRCSSL